VIYSDISGVWQREMKRSCLGIALHCLKVQVTGLLSPRICRPSNFQHKLTTPSPDRNTTLRHPSADTSPGACIESSDVPLSRTHSRVSSRHSFGFGHHRQKSYRYNAPIDMGSVNTAVAGAGGRTSVESIDEVMDGGSATTGKSSVEGGMAADTMNAVPNGVEKGWQGNQEGVGRDSSSLDLEKTRIQTDEQGYKTGQRKKGVLRKLHLHKV
jgi:hypothetical protein